MPYITMCKKDIKGFKKGMFFTAFHKSNRVDDVIIIANIDEYGREISYEYTHFGYSDFIKHFSRVNNYCDIKYLEEKVSMANMIKKLFKKSNIETIKRTKFISLKFDMPTLQKVYSKVLIYFLLLEDDECLNNVSEILISTLESLGELYKYKDLGVINFDEEIDKASEVFRQAYLLVKPMQEKIKENTNEFLISKLKEYVSMHNVMIKTNVEFLTELNRYNNI